MIQDTLGAPLTLPNGQVVPNRLLKSAMSETIGPLDNRVPETMKTLYGRWADGGIGLSVTGNVMIDRQALGEPGNVAIEDDRDLDELKLVAQAGKRAGGLIYVQLNHPGRQVPRFLNEDAVAPSAVPFGPKMASSMAISRALTDAEIEDIVQRFATAAHVCEQAGFDGVQIHGAHGYLVGQFLSPLTNQRTDRWGGTEDHRRRFPLAVARAIRAATGDGFGMAIKINSADFQRGGTSEDESMRSIQALAAEGMDFIEVSGGTYEAPAMMGARKKSTVEREAYFLEFAEKLRSSLQVPLCVTGGFRSGAAMAAAIDSGAVDMVGIARTVAVDPDFPNRLLNDGDVRVEIVPRKTGIGPIDAIGILDLIWYERQIKRMSEGRDPIPDEHPIWTALGVLKTHGFDAFRSRRAR
ncbi:MAG: NADH:flavin oxidoreductase/NADH oxidase family protein [Proteobacteria bacterium]|nr:NADH:flavin oxidoreductase/NADH oxidase family protein [Pseudomonadota bacterium]MCP4922248.1 NADH:flavin oxidoreductase/NADH oxidase family protein [Pseudomonadota bacterium]